MAEEPIKGRHYVSVVGLPGELRIFRREVSKLPEWALYDRDGVLFVAKRDADADDTPKAAEARTERLIKRVSRAFMLGPHKQPLNNLKCGGQLRVAEDGTKHHTIIIGAGKLTVSGGAVVAFGTVSGAGAPVIVRDPTKERIEALDTLEGDEAVETMFALFEAEGDRWGTLYNILERVRAALDSNIPREWISKADLALLERTANHDKAGGLTARHHAAKTEPPAKPMPLKEARDHVLRILDGLIQHRAAKARGTLCGEVRGENGHLRTKNSNSKID
jgi:hypothetical protein